MKTLISIVALLACTVIASPASLTIRNSSKRDLKTVNNLPSKNKDCNGDVFTPDNIKAAISVGWDARKNGKTDKNGYKWAGLKKPEKKQGYPHTYTPEQGKQKYEDFKLSGCAQDDDSKEKKANFMEFPIKIGGWDWTDKSDKGFQEGNRVVFQYIDDTTAAFCGIIYHNKGPLYPDFALCPDATDKNPARVAPYAEGTCSLHLKQWDLKDIITPRYQVEVTMFDNAKNQIGYLPSTGSQGDTPAYVSSALEDDLVVRANSEGDYVAFYLKPQSWPSNGQFGPGDAHNQCSVGGWDCGHGHTCNRQMDCKFTCYWGGGPSSVELNGLDGVSDDDDSTVGNDQF